MLPSERTELRRWESSQMVLGRLPKEVAFQQSGETMGEKGTHR
jgi:hypothetical protein